MLLNKWTLHRPTASAVMMLDILALDEWAVEAGTPSSRSSLYQIRNSHVSNARAPASRYSTSMRCDAL